MSQSTAMDIDPPAATTAEPISAAAMAEDATAPAATSGEDSLAPGAEATTTVDPKGKKPKKKQAAAEETEEEKLMREEAEKVQKQMKKAAVFNNAATTKLEAIISYNRIDLLDTSIQFENPWNPRGVEVAKATALKNEFMVEGLKPFSPENHINIVLAKDDLDPKCICTNLTQISKAPFIKLKNMLALVVYLIIGGQHRRKAVHLLDADYRKEKLQCEKGLKKARQLSEEAENSEQELEAQSEITRLERRVVELEELLPVLGIWGVTVLDKALIDDDVATTLARNRATYIYSEEDQENFRMTLKSFFSVRAKDLASTYKRDARLKGIFVNEDAREVLEEFNKYSTVYSAAGVFNLAELVQSTCGPTSGVINKVATFTAGLLPKLFNPNAIHINEAALIEQIAMRGKCTDEEWDKLLVDVEDAWSVFLSLEPHPDIGHLCNETLISNIDDLNATLFDDNDLPYATGHAIYDDGMKAYADKLSIVIKDSIQREAAKLTGDPHKTFLAMRAGLDKKLKLIYPGALRDFHNYPVLTPSSYKALVKTLVPLAEPITEIIAWISPTAPWFATSTGTSAGPKGAFAYALKDLQNDNTSPLSPTGRQRIGKELPFMIMENLVSVVAMAVDIHRLGDLWVRPESTNINTGSKAVVNFWNDFVKRLAPVQDTSDDILAYMKAASDTRQRGTKEVLRVRNIWPLNVPSTNHWYSAAKKNKDRDNKKYAICAAVEMTHARTARTKLFHSSFATQYMRTILGELLTQFVDTSQTTLTRRGQLDKAPQYYFPDGLQVGPPLVKTHLNIEDLVKLLARHKEFINARSKLQTIVSRVIRLPMAGITRDSKLITPQVGDALDYLAGVLHYNYDLQEQFLDDSANGEIEDLEYEDWEPPTDGKFTRPLPPWNLAPLTMWTGANKGPTQTSIGIQTEPNASMTEPSQHLDVADNGPRTGGLQHLNLADNAQAGDAEMADPDEESNTVPPSSAASEASKDTEGDHSSSLSSEDLPLTRAIQRPITPPVRNTRAAMKHALELSPSSSKLGPEGKRTKAAGNEYDDDPVEGDDEEVAQAEAKRQQKVRGRGRGKGRGRARGA